MIFRYLFISLLFFSLCQCETKRMHCGETLLLKDSTSYSHTSGNRKVFQSDWTKDSLNLDSIHRIVARKLSLSNESSMELQKNFSIEKSKSILKFSLCSEDANITLRYLDTLLYVFMEAKTKALENPFQEASEKLSKQLKKVEEEMSSIEMRMLGNKINDETDAKITRDLKRIQKENSSTDIKSENKFKIGEDSLDALKKRLTYLDKYYVLLQEIKTNMSIEKVSALPNIIILQRPRIVKK